jgi:hypothetical protein
MRSILIGMDADGMDAALTVIVSLRYSEERRELWLKSTTINGLKIIWFKK